MWEFLATFTDHHYKYALTTEREVVFYLDFEFNDPVLDAYVISYGCNAAAGS